MATRACVPTVRSLRETAQLPPESAQSPSARVPSERLTVPVAEPELASTEIVQVTAEPTGAGFASLAIRTEGPATAPENLARLYEYSRRLQSDPRIVAVDGLVDLDPRITLDQYRLLYGDPSGPPQRAKTFTGDYITALTGWGATMMALWEVQKTGRGQVVDLAQYEAVAQTNGNTLPLYTAEGVA